VISPWASLCRAFTETLSDWKIRFKYGSANSAKSLAPMNPIRSSSTRTPSIESTATACTSNHSTMKSVISARSRWVASGSVLIPVRNSVCPSTYDAMFIGPRAVAKRMACP